MTDALTLVWVSDHRPRATRWHLRPDCGNLGAATQWTRQFAEEGLDATPCSSCTGLTVLQAATLAIYAGPGGAAAAAEYANVSRRTVQRWAAREGVPSGYQQPAPWVTREQRREANSRRLALHRKACRFLALAGCPYPHSHGRSGYTNHGCLCPTCRAAGAVQNRERRQAANRRARTVYTAQVA